MPWTTRPLHAPGSAVARASAAGRRLWRALRKALFDPYRPEQHYMRGPGPKWREHHRPGAGR